MISDLNIRHHRDLDESEADPAKRRTITNQLAEEKIKLAGLVSEESKIIRQVTCTNGSADK